MLVPVQPALRTIESNGSTPLDLFSVLAGLLAVLLAAWILLSLIAWLRARRRGAEAGPQTTSGPHATNRRTGWRALQSAGKARVRARNRAELRGTAKEDGEEMLGKAHRKRLARRRWGGPWQ